MRGIERTMRRRSFSSSRDVVVGIVVAGWEGLIIRGGSFWGLLGFVLALFFLDGESGSDGI